MSCQRIDLIVLAQYPRRGSVTVIRRSVEVQVCCMSPPYAQVDDEELAAYLRFDGRKHYCVQQDTAGRIRWYLMKQNMPYLEPPQMYVCDIHCR